MKMALCLFLMLTLGANGSTFWDQLTQEERRAAGLEKLTPEQQAALNDAATRFVQEGRHREAENIRNAEVAKVAQAREQAKAEARAEVFSELARQRQADAGLPVRQDDQVIRTRILGDFRGWTGSTVFRLENGQVWQQSDRESRFFPSRKEPEVELIPSGWAGWKLRLVDGGLWIRVKRIR